MMSKKSTLLFFSFARARREEGLARQTNPLLVNLCTCKVFPEDTQYTSIYEYYLLSTVFTQLLLILSLLPCGYLLRLATINSSERAHTHAIYHIDVVSFTL